MKMITLYLPEPIIDYIDELVKQKRFPNRSEGLRVIIQIYIDEDKRFRIHGLGGVPIQHAEKIEAQPESKSSEIEPVAMKSS